MTAIKLLNAAGLLLKPEASYNAGGALSPATDGVQMMEIAQFQRNWADTGERPFAISPSEEKRVQASGRSYQGPVKTRVKGGGAAYSASVTPKDLHNLFRGSGHGATLVSTSGAEKYTYAPVNSGFTSLVGEGYYRGQKYGLQGIYGNLRIRGEAGKVCEAEYDLQGLFAGDLVDTSVPVITYAESVLPPKLENAQFAIGTFAAGVVRSFEFETGLTIVPRLNANAGTHAGFSIIDRKPRLKISLEMTSLVASPYHTVAGLNPYKLFELASTLGISFQIGSVQYNRLKFNAPQAQLAEEPGESDDNKQATWDLNFMLPPSAVQLLDHYTWVAD